MSKYLELLERVYNTRRQLVEVCVLKDLREFTELLASEVDETEVISVIWNGIPMYPIIQINPETMKVFDEIPSLIKDAKAMGYTSWDILEWLATEQFEEVAPLVGTPLYYKTPNDLIDQLFSGWFSCKSQQNVGYIPIELIRNKQLVLFNRLRQQWLCMQPENMVGW